MKPYYEDVYVVDFNTDIVSIEQIEGIYHILLKETYFYPGGGGQIYDIGYIDDIEVYEVYEKDNKIYHKSISKPKQTKDVKCMINKERRLDGMHQHLAQHIISGCFYKKFNQNTFGFHMGKEFSTIDIYDDVCDDKKNQIEIMVNDIIFKDLEVKMYTPSKKQLDSIDLRRDLPNTDNDIRIVEIEDLDINACCGVHPKSTLEVRLIKLTKLEKIKKGFRISYLAGQRAINYSLERDKYLNEICKLLKSTDSEAINYINIIKDKLDNSHKVVNELESQLALKEFKNLKENALVIDNISIIINKFENQDIKYINKIASCINLDNDTIGLFAIDNDITSYIYCCSKELKHIDMNKLLKQTLSSVGGRGGGNYFLAQGSSNKHSNIDNVFKDVIDTIKTIM